MGFRLVVLLFFLLLQTSCGVQFTVPASTNNTAAATATPEPSFCSTVTTYTPATTITGNAVYQYRATDVASGLTGNPVDVIIPGAEITVTNSSGTIVQCGTTNADGTFSVQVPRAAGSYSLKVSSRAYSNTLKVSVLNDIQNNQPYSISLAFSTLVTDVTKAIGTARAYARTSQSSQIEAGAFNILFNVYLANEYLRAQIAGISVPKVSAYWKAGFNPATYFGSSALLSFYLPGESQLFILGGTSGQVSTVDTDHFDDSIILHEYAHFLEDRFSISDSQGGSHNGNSFIDPRLAWSEGFANFFQSAVLRSDSIRGITTNRANRYIDTIGYSGDTVETGESGYVNINFNLVASGSNVATDDYVSQNNEGVFRELSVSRTLLKLITAYSTTLPYGVAIPFQEIWTVLSSTLSGNFANTNMKFRNSGNFFQGINTIINTSYAGNSAAWSAVLTNERQSIAPIEYNNPLIAQVGACGSTKTISPVVDSNINIKCTSSSSTISVGISNTLRSSDFFQFYHDGTSQSIRLDYSQVNVMDPRVDLDLIVYRSGYTYIDDYAENACGVQNSTISVRSRVVTDGDDEFVSLSGLSAGYYQIQVKVNTYGKNSAALVGSANYQMKLIKNSDSTERYLCPTY